MTLLLFSVLLLLPLSSFAQSTPPVGLHGSIHVYGAGTGHATAWDRQGNSVSLIGDEQAQFYTATSGGRVISQGWIFSDAPYTIQLPPSSNFPMPWDRLIPGAAPAKDHLFDGTR